MLSPTVVIHNSTAMHEKKRVVTLKIAAATLAHLLKTLSWSRETRVCRRTTRMDVPAYALSQFLTCAFTYSDLITYCCDANNVGEKQRFINLGETEKRDLY